MSEYHHTYRIDYLDPDDGEWKTIEETFFDGLHISSEMAAEDYAYSLADKGPHRVTRVK